MTIWCPTCDNETFNYQNVNFGADICKDKLKCRKCGYEFNIEWYSYIRSDWVFEQMLKTQKPVK